MTRSKQFFHCKLLTQSKSEMQKQEVCTVSSIALLLTLIRHNTVFIHNYKFCELQNSIILLHLIGADSQSLEGQTPT